MIKKSGSNFFIESTTLSQIEFHLVEQCNLNCAYCDHFTPLARGGALTALIK